MLQNNKRRRRAAFNRPTAEETANSSATIAAATHAETPPAQAGEPLEVVLNLDEPSTSGGTRRRMSTPELLRILQSEDDDSDAEELGDHDNVRDNDCDIERAAAVSDFEWPEEDGLSDYELVVSDAEPDSYRLEEAHIDGRRIVNLEHLFTDFIRKFGNHAPALNCPMRSLVIVDSRQQGLKRQVFFQCQMCLYKNSVWTEPENLQSMDIHHSAVAGCITSGIGYSQLEQLLAAVDIPNISQRTYLRYENDITVQFMNAVHDEMQAAGELEKELALKRGDVVDGIPHIPVVADGSWMKRSYRTGKYDSLSGVGAIVGYHTQKVLFIGVRNKFCATCERAARTGKEPTEHTCYKNWDRNRSSTSMESDAIVDGFTSSIDTHGLIYSTLIADGDSSVYKKILDSNPYPNMIVKKVECINHLLRNLATKIKDTLKNKGRIGKLRQVVEGSVLRLRTAVSKAAKFRSTEDGPTSLKARKLSGDILNIPSHVFGEHKKCAELGYFCDGSLKEGEENHVPALKAFGLYDKIQEAFSSLSCYSDSIILGVNSNSVERYNSIICKYIGGKRINYGARGSYTGRCAAAVIQFNTNKSLSVLSEAVNEEPTATLRHMEERHIRRNENKAASRDRCAEKRKAEKKNDSSATSRKVGRSNTTEDYGPNCQRPDLSAEENAIKTQYHYDQLLEWQADRDEIERTTRQQGQSERWLSIRKKILTASNFGRVCRMRSDTSCKNTVKSLLFPTPLRLPAIEYGRQCEEQARKQLATERNINITECGLFIDEELPYIGASPDGVIGDDGIVEIKCPFSIKNFAPEEAIAQKKGNVHRIFDSRGENMNESHEYFYQVQGQLHVTRRKYCIFAVWTPRGMKSIVVESNADFWSKKMQPFLTRFYKCCMVPEIIDSRLLRNMEIREPQYILDARQEKENRAASKAKDQAK